MIRVRVPGIGLDLTVIATTNGSCFHRGVVRTASRDVEIASGELIPAHAIKQIRYSGPGCWVDPGEARAVVLLLAAIGGMGHKELLAMAKIGMEPEVLPLPKRPRGRPRKHSVPDTEPWEEQPAGLLPAAALHRGRRWMDCLRPP